MKLPGFLGRIRMPKIGGPAVPELAGVGRLAGARKLMRKWGPWWLGTGGLLLMFTWLSIPTSALAWRIGHEARKAGYIIDVDDISISPFGGMTLHDVSWTFEPSRPDQIPTKFIAEEIEVDVSLFALAFGELDVDVEGVIDDGSFAANYTRGEEGLTFTLEVRELPLRAIPKAAQAFNAPLMGTFEMSIDLVVPEHKWAQAEGSIELSCTTCRVGDGETPLFIPGATKGLMAKGITVPEIDLGSLGGRIVITEGNGAIEGAIETKSDDIDVALTGNVLFKDPFKRSQFDLVLKLDFKESLQERSEALRLMVQTASKKSRLEPPEKGLGFRLSGPFARPTFRGINTRSLDDRLRDRRDQARRRQERRRRAKQARETEKPKLEVTPLDDAREDEAPPTIGEPISVTPVSPDGAAMPSTVMPAEGIGQMPLPPPAPEGGEQPEEGQPPPRQPEPEEQPQDEQQQQDEQQPQDSDGQPAPIQ